MASTPRPPSRASDTDLVYKQCRYLIVHDPTPEAIHGMHPFAISFTLCHHTRASLSAYYMCAGWDRWSVLKQRMRPPQPGCVNRLGSREVAPKAGVHNEDLLAQLERRWTWRMARRPAGSEQSRCCRVAFVRCHAVLELAPLIRIHAFGV